MECGRTVAPNVLYGNPLLIPLNLLEVYFTYNCLIIFGNVFFPSLKFKLNTLLCQGKTQFVSFSLDVFFKKKCQFGLISVF